MNTKAILLILLAASCNSETPGEYRGRIENVACKCITDKNLFVEKRNYPDCNEVASFSKEKRDSLLMPEQGLIDEISECMKGNKLSAKDIYFYWHNYDVYKVFECRNPEFRKFYSYVAELRRGCL